MKEGLQIHASVVLSGRQVILNGSQWYAPDTLSEFGTFSKEVYRKLEMQYLKFYKMDNLCKQGILAGELLLQQVPDLPRIARDRIGICIGSAFGSLDTDQRYFTTYHTSTERIPSPGLFVYTLPNILIGELCIRHKITGEQACFVGDPTQLECLYLYVRYLFSSGHADACLVGWNDYYDTQNLCAMAWIVRQQEDITGPEFERSWLNDILPDGTVLNGAQVAQPKINNGTLH